LEKQLLKDGNERWVDFFVLEKQLLKDGNERWVECEFVF
jgi:hypothetical protein